MARFQVLQRRGGCTASSGPERVGIFLPVCVSHRNWRNKNLRGPQGRRHFAAAECQQSGSTDTQLTPPSTPTQLVPTLRA